ncbi:unnamed protein product [Cylicocyclus nassatus]|uniref:Uncharacterized protein n=1 Tax=Cylicocyclus nassatus TaxID=53992 RepID=A0AA36GZ15_CYLNA|nr:unnamed protein product [Cylicocyclus nassatus]
MEKEMAAIKQQIAQANAAKAQSEQQNNVAAGYPANVRAFISEAISKRIFSLSKSNVCWASRGINPQEQAYAKYESEFIEKMTSFGNKWGLTENELVLFGNKALKDFGINVANVPASALERVFSAVYPEAIRHTSQQNETKHLLLKSMERTGVPENPNANQEKMAEKRWQKNFINSHYPRR